MWFCLREASKSLQFEGMSWFRAEVCEVLIHISALTSVCFLTKCREATFYRLQINFPETVTERGIKKENEIPH